MEEIALLRLYALTMEMNDLSDDAILQRLGQRLARHRLNLNRTQAELALEAGVSRRSIYKIENGLSVDTRILVRILRALDLLDGLEMLAPEPAPSPMALLEARGRERIRASGSRKASRADKPAESTGWQWPDEHS